MRPLGGAVSHEEEVGLRAYQAQLRLTDADMAPVMPQLMRAKQLAAIIAGHLPVVVPPGIMLPVGEVAHYVTGAALLMTTYSTSYVRATRGSTVRVARGVSFRVSGTRGINDDHWRKKHLFDRGVSVSDGARMLGVSRWTLRDWFGGSLIGAVVEADGDRPRARLRRGEPSLSQLPPRPLEHQPVVARGPVHFGSRGIMLCFPISSAPNTRFPSSPSRNR